MGFPNTPRRSAHSRRTPGWSRIAFFFGFLFFLGLFALNPTPALAAHTASLAGPSKAHKISHELAATVQTPPSPWLGSGFTPEPTQTPEPTPAPTRRRNPNDGLSDAEVDVLSGLSVGFSAVSFVGSSFIIGCFFLFKDLRTFAFRLVFYMSLADLGYSVGKFFGDAGGDHSDHTHPACTLQALLISFFSLSSIAWCVCIAHTLHQAIIRRNPDYAPRHVVGRLPFFFAFAWGLPLLLTILPTFSGSYGDTGAWCWIKTDRSVDVFWRYLCFYVPLWLAIPYNAYVYVHVRAKIRADSNSGGGGGSGNANGGEDVGEGNESSRQMVRRIIFYPLVLVICFLPATINRTYEAFNTHDRQAWLTGIHIIFATSLGMGNAIVYGLEKSVRARIAALLCGGRTDLFEDDGMGGSGNVDLSVSLHALDPHDLRHAEHLEL